MSGPPAPASTAASKAKHSKKRKAPADETDDVAQPSTTTTTTTTTSLQRKPKQKKNRKPNEEDDDALLDLDVGVNTIFTRMDPDLLADYVAAKTKRFGSDLSSVELSDLYVPAGAIRDTTTFAETRVKEKLPAFLEAFAGSGGNGEKEAVEKRRLGTAPKQCGAPHTIVVAGAGLRAADLVR